MVWFVQVLCLCDVAPLLAASGKKQKRFSVGVVKSANLRQFNQVVLGLQSNLSAKLYKLHIITINKSYSKEKVHHFLSKNKISLVICLGEVAAVYFAQLQSKVPVLFSLVLNYQRFKSLRKKHVAGISMEISSQNLFAQFRLLYGGLKKIVLPYHPKASSEVVEEAKRSANFLGVTLTAIPIQSAKVIIEKLHGRKSKFDSIWMISDFKLYNSSTFSKVKDLFGFAKKNKKPVFVSSDVFLKTGGLFSVSVDYLSLGSQLALLTNRVTKNSEKMERIGVMLPIGTRTVLNMKVARELVEHGVLGEEVLYEYEADVFYESKQ